MSDTATARSLELDLDEYLAAEEPGEESIAIEDDLIADTYLRRLKMIEDSMAEDLRKADEEHNKIDVWLTPRRERHHLASTRIKLALETYMRNRGGAKTVSLPHGTLKLHARSGIIDVRDPEKFVAWARAGHKSLLRIVEPEPEKRELSKLDHRPEGRPFGDYLEYDLLIEGEIVPGAYWLKPQVPTFHVEAV